MSETNWGQSPSSILANIEASAEKIKYMHSGPIVVGPEMAKRLIELGFIKKSDITVIEE